MISGRLKKKNIFHKNSRKILNHFWEFRDKHKNIQNVFHHTISSTAEDTSYVQVKNSILSIIKQYPDSLFFFTEKTKLLRKAENNPNLYLPLENNQIENIDLMIDLISKKWLRPYPGHTCMAITESTGKIIPETQVSLRPRKPFLDTQSIFHPHIYHENFPAFVAMSQQTTLEDEIDKLSRIIFKNKKLSADITVIPLAIAKINPVEFMKNIKSAQALKIYSLCSSIVKNADIDKISDTEIRHCVLELKKEAKNFPELHNATKLEQECVLTALACTHAIAKACIGDAYGIDKEIGPDQDTQTVVIYLTIALTGTKRFHDFAKSINFHDNISDMTKRNRS